MSRARAVIATGRKPAVVARVAGVSRQALYRPISRRPPGAGPGHGRPGDDAIVEVARANPVDGTRMVAALASRALGEPVNRKRVQRVMRAHGLLQRSRSTDRRRRPGYFRVRRPDELWHLDMTKVWTAAHGWVYLHVAVDCCTREVAGWTLDLRTRTDEAIACVEGAVLARSVAPGRLTLGTDNGSQFTSRDFRKHLSARGITHRRGGYRDPSPRRSSSPGSDSSRSAAPGAPSGRPSTRHVTRSPPTSTPTTTARTPGWPTAPPPRSPAPGPTPNTYTPQRPDPSTTTGSTSATLSLARR
ncbi:hypothetical protein CUD01_03610 [Cellulomonas uda]|uniref:Integrase catalytic domain-containing protein n=1 Tax=Cellulomonas uda TaxID=1714 RepID=A0A4Y3K7K6_CELUD|nr:hypothetical protein CUD01_03610 [Cellulomonas uda]